MVLSAITHPPPSSLCVSASHGCIWSSTCHCSGAGDFRAVLLQAHPPCTGVASTEGGLESGWKILAALTGKGLPVAVMNSVTAIGGMVLQVFVNQMGTAYVAAYAACMKVCGLFEQPGVTVGLALLTFTGQNLWSKEV